ncbi:hypothetical protein GCM10020331_046770 [Ectobacillus funiculus]
MKQDTLKKYPELKRTINMLAGKLTDEKNARTQLQGRQPERRPSEGCKGLPSKKEKLID